MAQEEIENWRKEVKDIIDLITKRQIAEVLTTYFELDEMPKIIAINRGLTSIKGFVKICKKIFVFGIIFLKENGVDKLEVILGFGRHSITKVKEISIKDNDEVIEVYLKENMQYLFSVYF